MLRRTGRAAQRVAGHGGRVLHRVVELALGLTMLTAAGLGVLGWRLSQGPVRLDWLAHQLEDVISADLGASVRVDTVALAWEGFGGGVDQPIDLRLTGLRALGPAGITRAGIPEARVSLSMGALLLGRLVPRAVEIDRPTLSVLRAADGAVSLDLGGVTQAGAAADSGAAPADDSNPFDAILGELALAPEGDRAGGGRLSRLHQMRRLLIRDARLTVVDQQLGATWRAPSARIDLHRDAAGGVAGDLDIQLVLGSATARLTAAASLAGGGTATLVRAQLTPVTPAALASAAPALRALAAVDAPVTLDASAELGAGLALRHATLRAGIGAGVVHAAGASIALRGGALLLTAEPQEVALTSLRLTVPSPGGAADSVVQASGRLRRTGATLQAQVVADIDRVAFADLPALWPPGVAEHARGWIVQNITAGTARQAHVAAALTMAPDFSDAALTGLSGSITGDDLTLYWLRPVPPVLHGQALLTLDNTDALTIAVLAGQQSLSGGAPSGLAIRGGSMRIYGLTTKDQFAALTLDLAGPVADAMAVLRQPRLHLFDSRPLDLRDPSGSATAKLTLHLPLKDNIGLEQLQIAAHARLSALHLTGLVAGRNLDHGQLDLDVSGDGLSVSGQADLASIPAQLTAALDFRQGPAAQVVEQATVSGSADADQLRRAGLDSAGVLVGPTTLNAAYTQHRDGSAELAVRADMAAAGMGVSALGWRKTPGTAATAAVRILLQKDRIVGMDGLRADGDGLLVRGSADYADGHPDVLRLDQVVLGRTSLHGQVRFPATADQPIRVALHGERLDLATRLDAPAEPTPAEPPPDDSAGPPYVVDAQFDATLLAESRPLGALSAHVENDGRVITRARLEAAGARHVLASIVPRPDGRALSLEAGDGGALLRALGVTRHVIDGALSVTGTFDDRSAAHPLTAVARLDGFRVNNAPAIGKILQGMTLYGLVDALQGPGLGFSQLIAPFRLVRRRLELEDARAFSPSLGMTAKGTVDLGAQTVDLQGTIVPAYFFNSLLGNIPFVGRLFSPEKDGGVFAATYALSGRLDDPAVSVNPLAALTPGFLRGVFGMFDQPGVR